MPEVVVITGAARGIGAATALAAARQGDAVAVNYRQDAAAAEAVAARIRAAGGRALAVQADVAGPRTWRACSTRPPRRSGPSPRSSTTPARPAASPALPSSTSRRSAR